MKKLPMNRFIRKELKCKELTNLKFLQPMTLFLDGNVKHPEWGIFLGFYKNEKKHKGVGVRLDLKQAVFIRDYLNSYISKVAKNSTSLVGKGGK